MRFRDFGKTGYSVAALSIGAMRLPKDYDEATALVRRAIDLGCNYIDTSRGYGESELKLARALKDGYRERVILSTKCSPWIYEEEGYTTSADDARRKIDDSMTRLEVDRLDFYQVWNIHTAEVWAACRAPGAMVDGIHQAMDEGLVDHMAATTHAPEEVVFEMIDSGLFETLTVTYHLLDRERERVMERAAEQGIGIVVMNPLAGGALAFPSSTIGGFLPERGMTSKQLALRFVLDHPAVSCIISGISRLSDVEENAATWAMPPLTAEERAELARRAAALEGEGRQFCTQCGYCMPCKNGVSIKGIFNLMTRARLFGLNEWARTSYAAMKAEARADRCVLCGECEPKCTNHMAICEELERAHAFLTGGEATEA